MELVTKKRLKLLAGRSNLPLAAEIAEFLGVELGHPNLVEFANGEIHSKLGENVRGADVFIIQTHGATDELSVNDVIMEQLIMIDAARRASAKRITAVIPNYGYARQDRKAEGREPITAKLVANMFAAAGANRLMSVDLHSGQIQGFFDGPVDHLTAMPVLVDYIKEHLPEDLVVVSPDAGRVKVAERYTNILHADLAIVHKRRVKDVKNTVEAMEIVGDVRGRTCVIIDDMIDTGGTLCAGADQLAAYGAKEIYALATHGVLSGPAIDRIKNSVLSKVIVTNTLPLPASKQIDKIEVLSIAKVLAETIDAVFEDKSVSEIFDGANQN
ncbi:MAG TPA: ribose-phosphate diphosphokinase [Acidimicrobiales bacterium]